MKPEILEKCEWTESVNQARGLRCPRSDQIRLVNLPCGSGDEEISAHRVEMSLEKIS